ncbi:MAG: ribosome silencing factor [Candidatus Neomarinimicrobiota bacterium]|nr:ribosome silencing factor [Candidatus Neomarinimicrobiota bacterium]|tara:strand:+ start:1527 stop:1895 length:369 start_codon:yes stop_codon:yes gene_type:complete
MTLDKHIKLIGDLLLEKKSKDITVLEVEKITSITDFIIICTSNSSTQTKAIVDHIRSRLKELGSIPLNIEGYSNLSWVLMDYGNIIIHVFLPEFRKFYNLERLWGDAKSHKIDDIQRVINEK